MPFEWLNSRGVCLYARKHTHNRQHSTIRMRFCQVLLWKPVSVVTDASMSQPPSSIPHPLWKYEMFFATPFPSMRLSFASDSRFLACRLLIHVTSHLVNSTNGFYTFCEVRFFEMCRTNKSKRTAGNMNFIFEMILDVLSLSHSEPNWIGKFVKQSLSNTPLSCLSPYTKRTQA